MVRHTDIEVALAQDALLRDVVERKGVIGVDALEAVFLVAFDDRAGAGIQAWIVREEKVGLAACRTRARLGDGVHRHEIPDAIRHPSADAEDGPPDPALLLETERRLRNGEDAAVRELREETGVVARREDLRYFGSQAWPLPSSLLMAFEVEVESDAITIDPEELIEARFFAPEDLNAIRVAGPISLAGRMIAAFRSAAS